MMADTPMAHDRDRLLSEHRDEVRATAAELHQRVAVLESQRHDALVSADLESAASAAGELEALRPELASAEAAHHAATRAAEVVALERHRIDVELRLAELNSTRDAAIAEATAVVNAAPAQLKRLQDGLRMALQHELIARQAESEASQLRAVLAAWPGQPQISRTALPTPATGPIQAHAGLSMLVSDLNLGG